ncbi:SpoIIE family protein phosphatase [Streptomyces albidoflavus]
MRHASAEDADRPGDHPALDALRELPPTSLFVFDAALDLQRYHAAAPHHVLGEVAGEPVEDGSAGLLDEEVYALLRKAQEEDRMQTRAVVSRATSGEERALTLAAHPLRDPEGGPGGVAAQIADLSGERHDYGRLDTLVEEEALTDRSLNVADTAQRLVDMMAARLADTATVDILDCVLRGELPRHATVGPQSLVRRVSAGTDTGERMPVAFPVGGRHGYPHCGPFARALADHRPHVAVLGGDDDWWLSGMVERKLAPAGAHALIVVPLIAEGRLLGLAALYRTGEEEPFTQDDLATAVRMVRQAEQAVDNARRFTLEQAAAQLLRRSLAPCAPQDTRTVHTAEGHLQDIGNAWCEVIPLSGARTALVIGDVAEPGVRGIALMGRLRAGLLALAEQDPEPGELLSRLATLTARLARDVHLGLRAPEPLSTCLYLVYDPVEHTCQAASAGHPAPLIGPGDGPMRTAPLDIGPPLGPDRHAYETSRFPLADQSEIALFTSGLTALAEDGPEDGRPHRSAALREALSHARGSLEERCDQALGRFLGRRPTGDALLLLARTRPLPPVDVATWELSDSPEQVASARRSCAEQLTRWGLGDLAFTTELLVSELVTNAIRYGSAPVRLRLIRDRALVCEVHDASSSAPRVCHATGNDERGRGLFMIEEMADRWGVRFDPGGKTVWAEQDIGEETAAD